MPAAVQFRKLYWNGRSQVNRKPICMTSDMLKAVRTCGAESGTELLPFDEIGELCRPFLRSKSLPHIIYWQAVKPDNMNHRNWPVHSQSEQTVKTPYFRSKIPASKRFCTISNIIRFPAVVPQKDILPNLIYLISRNSFGYCRDFSKSSGSSLWRRPRRINGRYQSRENSPAIEPIRAAMVYDE